MGIKKIAIADGYLDIYIFVHLLVWSLLTSMKLYEKLIKDNLVFYQYVVNLKLYTNFNI